MNDENDFKVSQKLPLNTWDQRFLYNLEYSEKTGMLYKIFSIVILLFCWKLGASYSFVQNDILVFLFLQNMIVTVVFFNCLRYRKDPNKIFIITYILMLSLFLAFYFDIRLNDISNLDIKTKRMFVIFSFYYFCISCIVFFNNIFYAYNMYLKNNDHIKKIMKINNLKIMFFNISFFIIMPFFWLYSLLWGDVFVYSISFFFLGVFPYLLSILIVKFVKNLEKGVYDER